MNSCVTLAGKLLLQENVRNGFSGNVVVSPLSLNAVAAMVAAGCSEGTAEYVLSFLGCNNLEELKSMVSEMMEIATSSDKEGSPKISFANGAWVDKRFPLKQTYRQCVANVFKSEAKNVDFLHGADKAVEEINSWAEFHTNGLIKSVIKREHIIPPPTLILGNALYFKGAWEHKFDPATTDKRDFFLINGDKVSEVPFLTNSSSYLYGTFEDNKVLEIPYQTGKKDRSKFAMQFILPNKKDGLRNLLDKFNSESSGFLNCHLQLENTVKVRIPKFKFSCSLDEIEYPFMEKEVELTEMVDDARLRIWRVIQKAFIEVDEEGTEAAAVTLAMIGGCARFQKPPEIKSFVADHPFMFIIKEVRSGLVLFVGAVLNPL